MAFGGPIATTEPVANMSEPVADVNSSLRSTFTDILGNENNLQASDTTPQFSATEPTQVYTQEMPAMTDSVSGNAGMAPEFQPIASEMSLAYPDQSQQNTNLFETIPSDVVIPNTPTNVETNEPLSNALPDLDRIANATSIPQTNSGGVVRFILWFLILILGVISLILGMYFAQVLSLPFLDQLFKR